MGNGSQYIIGAMRVGTGLFIGVEGLGAYLFLGTVDNGADGIYQAFGIDGEANFADFVNDQFERHPRLPRAGTYRAEHCNTEENQDESY
jgi:hypothetical protein